jgi:NTE family protein
MKISEVRERAFAMPLPSPSADPATVGIVHLIYRGGPDELASTDYEFSRSSIEERWKSGYTDVMRVDQHRDWLVDSSPELGVRVYDVHEPQARTP